jgi:S1-C subfamily serine protease
MKLYSREQVILFSLAGIIITALIAVSLIQFGVIKPQKAETAENTTGETAFNTGEGIREKANTPKPAEPVELYRDYGIPPRINTADAAAYNEDEWENISIYERLNAAVVNITTETVAINWFLEPVPQEGGSGSGSIIDTQGYVLTNNHVIQNAYKVFINLADGSRFEGSIAGADPENDIAVLKFDPPKGMELKTIPYGSSDNLKVGQKVLAIGNPFGFERTLTVGIVSGLGRPIQTSRQNIIRDMIQTDASINPGNSGGPLLDTQGRMIGINTLIRSPSGGSVGIGFAVPVNTAKRVVTELIRYGKVRRGWIDATVVQLFPDLVQYARLPVRTGLLVSRVRRNGSAEKAGLIPGNNPVRYGSSVIYLGGDIITSVDGMKTETLADLYSALEDNKPGEKIKVEIIRDRKTLSLEIVLADREEVLRE